MRSDKSSSSGHLPWRVGAWRRHEKSRVPLASGMRSKGRRSRRAADRAASPRRDKSPQRIHLSGRKDEHGDEPEKRIQGHLADRSKGNPQWRHCRFPSSALNQKPNRLGIPYESEINPAGITPLAGRGGAPAHGPRPRAGRPRHAPGLAADAGGSRRARSLGRSHGHPPEHGLEVAWGTAGKSALNWRVTASRTERGGAAETVIGVRVGLRR